MCTPAGVAAFHDVVQALLVAEVTVVIDREQVAVFVEGQLLRIAQAVGEDFKAAAIRLDAEDAALTWIVDVTAILQHYADALVARAPVDAAIHA